ncbi:MAG TPA: hypothetical protein VGC04_00235 [Cellulomonas sp.]
MPWVVIWPVLVVGALVGAFFLGRDLWRRGLRLAHAASAASEAVGRLSDRQEELTSAARARHPVPPVAFSRDLDDVRAGLAAARDVHDRRIDERHARYRLVMRRWLDVWR